MWALLYILTNIAPTEKKKNYGNNEGQYGKCGGEGGRGRRKAVETMKNIMASVTHFDMMILV
jgi:hypothetical protein